MAGWFRLYDELLDDPKVQKLPPEDFRAFINLLCLANRHGGVLPDMDEVAFALRMDNIGAISVVDRLVIATLFDRVKGGSNGVRIAPHGWQKRQYKSDSSTERTKRFRERHKDDSGNAPEQSRTEQNIPLSKDNGEKVDLDRLFWESGKAFLKPYIKGDPGALVGKWCRDYGKPETRAALSAAQSERAVDPVSFVTKVLKNGHSKGGDTWGETGFPC